MTKRRYRSTEIKKVDVARLAEAVGDTVIVGVDIAKQDMFCAVMDAEAQVHCTVRWKHPQQSSVWQRMVEELGADGRQVQVVMEPSGVYGDALRWGLEQAGIAVFRVNPKRSHDAAEVYDGVPSLHDAKSAAIVGKLHLDGTSEPWPMRSERERSLTAAVRLLEVYEKQFQKNRNRLEAHVSRHWPELSRVLDLGSVTLLELLKHFGGPSEVAAAPQDARVLMRRVGGHFLDPDKVEQVISSASRTAGVPQIDEEKLLVRELAAEARRNQQASKRQQKRVKELTQAHEASASMRAVVGPTTAGVLVAAIGDPRHYSSAYAYTKGLGLNLKEKSSGKQKGPLHITKRGPGVARLFLYLAALRMIQHDPICRAWYAKKVQRQGGRLKSKAVVALMRKLAKALWHVAHGAEFDAALLFDKARLNLIAEVGA